MPLRLCLGSKQASTAATTTGKYSGRHPAITELIASFSIVAIPPCGKIIGLVDDGAGKAYFQRIEELLEERVKPAQIIRKVKPILSRPASAEILYEVAKVCNAVIAGLGM